MKMEVLLFEADRLKTFQKNWKELKGFENCQPKNFAEAGFYNFSSKEFPDNVKCFSCQKELSNWEEEDDPWQEHIKRGNKCPFIEFKTKNSVTVKDLLVLYFETKKILIRHHFNNKQDLILEKEKLLLETLDKIKTQKK